MALNVIGWEFKDETEGASINDTTTAAFRYDHIQGYDSNVFEIRVRSNNIRYAADKSTYDLNPNYKLSTLAESALSKHIKDKDRLEKAQLLEKHNKLQLDNLSTIEKKLVREINVPGQGMSTFKSEEVQYVIKMHIPPEELNFNYNQQLTKNKVRNGWNIESWGEDLVTIEASGSSGIFYISDLGITRLNAPQSYGYRELMEVLQFYRNNGMSYDPVSGTIYVIGEVIIAYDGKEYSGSFDSFDIRESVDNPYRFTYQFTFVARTELGSNARVRGHFVPRDSLLKTNNVKLMSEVEAIRKSKQEEVAQSLANQRSQVQNTLEELRRQPSAATATKPEDKKGPPNQSGSGNSASNSPSQNPATPVFDPKNPKRNAVVTAAFESGNAAMQAYGAKQDKADIEQQLQAKIKVRTSYKKEKQQQGIPSSGKGNPP